MREFRGFLQVSALALMTGLSACGGAAQTPPAAAAESKAVPVRVATAAPASFTSDIPAFGRVEPDRSFVLAFKTAGVVRTLSVEAGDRVTKGQVLAELDSKDVDSQARQAKEQADKAQRDLERARQLNARGFASKAALQDAEAQAQMTQAAARAARSTQGYATIVAPSDGVVLLRNIEANSVVAAGAPVMTISDMSESFVLSAGLADRDAVRVSLGDSAEVSFDAFPEQVFKASLTEIGGDADARTGTYQIKLRIADKGGVLRSGLVGRATIKPARQSVAGLAIPVDAILEGHGSEAFVFVVDPATGAAKHTRIKTGRLSGALVAVTGGLDDGAQVVVDGAGYLTDGEKVAIATAQAE